jgi:O-antigen/teichoic acid export membrane protein
MALRNLIYQSIIWRGLYFLSVLILNIMIARYYEAPYSGVIYFVVNSYALVVIAGSLSLESGTSYFLASGQAGAVELSFFSLIWAIVVTAVIAVVLWLMLKLKILPEIYDQYFIAAILYTGGCILSNFFTSLFYAMRSFLVPNLLMVIVNLLLIAMLPFTGNLVSRKGYIELYFGGFLLQGVLLTIAFFIVSGSVQKVILPWRKLIPGILRYAFQALGANILFFLLYRIDYWFVERYCTAADLGNYIQVSKLVQVFFIIPMMVASAVFPVSANKNRDISRFKQSILKISRVLTFMSLFACILLAALGHWLFPLIYGSTFNNMHIPFLLLIPGILSLNILSILSAFFAGQNKVWVNLAGAILGLLTIIILDVAFIPHYGIVAAALISSIGYMINLLFSVWYFKKGQHIALAEFFYFSYKEFNEIKNHLMGELFIKKGNA